MCPQGSLRCPRAACRRAESTQPSRINMFFLCEVRARAFPEGGVVSQFGQFVFLC